MDLLPAVRGIAWFGLSIEWFSMVLWYTFSWKRLSGQSIEWLSVVQTNDDSLSAEEDLVWPIYEYNHTAEDRACVIGGYVYNEVENQSLQNIYVFGDYIRA